MTKWCILAAAACGLAGCDSISGSDDDGDRGAVFTMNNAASANYVIVYSPGADITGRLPVSATGLAAF